MKTLTKLILTSLAITSPTLAHTTFANTPDYAYDLNSVQAQYHNWLLVNDTAGKISDPNQRSFKNTLVQGGLTTDPSMVKDNYFITSEGLGFQVLLSAGILNLADASNPQLIDQKQHALNAIEAVYQFIYSPNPSQPNSKDKLVNGLLPWAWWMNKNTYIVSVAKKGTDIQNYSATDGDIFLAKGFYQASLYLKQTNPTIASKYKTAAINLMHAILKYDTAFGDNIPPYYLNEGGNNASGNHNASDGLAYTKTPFSFIKDFSNWDNQNKDKWDAIIKNTLSVMDQAQKDAANYNSQWGGVLGFINQEVPGAAFVTVKDNTLTFDSTKTFQQWNFNYDAGRVPMFLGAYIIKATANENDFDMANVNLAKQIIQNEMGSRNTIGLNTFFDYQHNPSNGFLINLPENIGAPIFINGSAQQRVSSDGGYTDDFLNSAVFLGNIANEGNLWSTANPNSDPAAFTAVTLMNSYSGSYYDGAYKIMSGLFTNGAFGASSITPNNAVLAAVHQTQPVIFNPNTYVYLYPGQIKPYYANYYVAPGTMKADQTYYVRVEAPVNENVTFMDYQNWGGSQRTTEQLNTKNCAIFKVEANRTDYYNIGLLEMNGFNVEKPTISYQSAQTKAQLPPC
ncbi:MAG: hypothetical protein EP298_10410 [Gammaproteobacteria bacterium]|nr:MAG: hypothetical protein EP298_10410 [Gammaproteobacteria bacterium]UTW42184.1 hypothetical protein KFE69_11930 [bacterium SCSIO 12844]